MGGLRETFRGMMVASSRPWFDKAMTIGPWQHKTNKIEERNNIFDRSTKSQLIFWPFKSKFRSFLAKRNGCGFPRILQVLATKNAWDEQTAAEQNTMAMSKNGVCPTSYFPFISEKSMPHFETRPSFLQIVFDIFALENG